MSISEEFFNWFNIFSKEFSDITGEKMNANHCLSAWIASNSSLSSRVFQNARKPGRATAIKFTNLILATQHLVEVYDSEDGKQWTATSKREAIAKAREAIDKALGE